MIYRKIDNTTLEVSAICLGGVALSTPVDREMFQLLDHYADQGGNMIDTANVYGKWFPGNAGTSEQNIGSWLHERRRRHDILIATKGGHPELADMATPRLSRADVARDLDESLKNLRTDYIDLYWLHRDDPSIPVGEMLQYLQEFAAAGKIRAFGCSNWSPDRIAEAIKYADQHHVQGFCANQLMWSLARPNPEAVGDLVAMDEANLTLHRSSGLPAFAYMSLANGFFTKLAASSESALDGRLKKLYLNDTNLNRFNRARKLALELGVSVTALSVCYLMSQPDFATFPIAGCRTVSQLDEILAVANCRLDGGALAELAGQD